MAWIESHQSLSRHRKTIRAAAILKVDRHKFIGHLHELWWWGLDNASLEGSVGPISAVELALAAEWPARQAEAFLEALVEVRFMDRGEGGDLFFHDWYEYAGKLLNRRLSNKVRQQVHRERNPLRNASDEETSSARHALRHASVTGLQNSTEEDHSVLTEPVEPSASPSNLNEWKELIRGADNKVKVLIDMARTHSKDPKRKDDGDLAAALLKDAGDPEYAASLVWTAINASERQGSIFKYAMGILSKQKERRNGEPRGNSQATRRPGATSGTGLRTG